jgi:8-oxo-dGTP pyrophosphatase MutT (NUDIX family)
MALSKYPTEQFPSSNFLICGGSILFASTRAPLQVCLLHHNVRDEWLLPKGRKDRGEGVPATAVRETFEETGYPCRLLDLDLVTRAPAAGSQTKDAAAPIRASEEPFLLTLRRTEAGGVKFIWWFATVRTAEDKLEGTQTAVESFESSFFPVDEALHLATFQTDRDVIARAVELVRETYPEAREEQQAQSQP